MPWIWLNFHANPCAMGVFFEKKKSVNKKTTVVYNASSCSHEAPREKEFLRYKMHG